MNQASPNTNTAQPNILFIFADNLGWGELGCYGGGELRGAPTPRIDELAQEGLRFLNFNFESDCVPTRSALMTERHAIRTGALGSGSAGIIPWEITLSQLLSDQGYATGIFGKWHLGDTDSRLPHRRGFDEWYGIPRTTNESMFTDALGFDPSVSFIPVVMEAEAGKTATELGVYDLEMRRLIDAEITRRTIDFCQRTVSQGRRFFAYVPLTQLHFPTLPHHDFAGQTGAGDFADSMVEMDHRVRQMLDCIEELGVAEDTLVLFGSDNGPEFRRPWRGTAGPWQGTYHSAMEGGLRVPFMIRWPGLIEPGQVTNEMVHMSTCSAHWPESEELPCRRIGRSTELTISSSSSARRRTRSARGSFSTSGMKSGRRSGATGRCTTFGNLNPMTAQNILSPPFCLTFCRTRRKKPVSLLSTPG